jgi:hypothetical protein
VFFFSFFLSFVNMSALLTLWGKEQFPHYWVQRDHQSQEICILWVSPKSKQQGYGQHHPFTLTGYFQEVFWGTKKLFSVKGTSTSLLCFLLKISTGILRAHKASAPSQMDLFMLL